jgi:hypothetical protein
MPQVASFQELNQLLMQHCLRDDVRVVDRQTMSIGEAFGREQSYLRPLRQQTF